MIDSTSAVQKHCAILSVGFLVAGCLTMAISPKNLLPAVILLLLSLVSLFRLCLYPRRYTRCKLCGKRVMNEVHHQIAHASEHTGRKDQ